MLYHLGMGWVFSGLLPELLLVGALFFASNRRLRAWWIWVPFGVVLLERWLLQIITGDSGSSDASEIFTWSIEMLGCGLALVWLLGDRFRSLSFFSSWILALGIFLAPAVVGWVSQIGLRGGDRVMAMWIVYGLGVITLLLAFSYCAFWLSRSVSRGRSSRGGGWFTARFFFGCVLTGLAVTIAAGFIVTTIQGQWRYTDWRRVLSETAVGGLILGVAVFLLVVPFLILAFTNSFYRDRFRGVFPGKASRESDRDGGDAQVSEAGEAELPSSFPQPTKESAG